jgi:deoxyribonuclease V
MIGSIAEAEPGDIMGDIFLSSVLPRLRMDQWIWSALSTVDSGEVTTFSAIASALGEPRAARAVAELISKGSVNGPVHRVVYSDGRVPERWAAHLGSEVALSCKGGISRVDPSVKPIGFTVEDPPFTTLSRIQTVMVGIDPGPRRIGPGTVGTDISTDMNRSAAALCLMDKNGDVVGATTIQGDLPLPYVPGHLFYREAPLLIPLLRRARSRGLLDDEPLVLIDGNGKLHPRRSGVACQIGLMCPSPTCGVAKKLLIGSIGEWSRGSVQDAPIRIGMDVMGMAMRNGTMGPFYVSEGRGAALATCCDRVRACLRGRYPEPLAVAHRLANSARRELQNP